MFAAVFIMIYGFQTSKKIDDWHVVLETSKDSDKDKNKKESLGTFYNLPQYVKIYDVLKSVYAGYKVRSCMTLDMRK